MEYAKGRRGNLLGSAFESRSRLAWLQSFDTSITIFAVLSIVTSVGSGDDLLIRSLQSDCYTQPALATTSNYQDPSLRPSTHLELCKHVNP